MTDLTIEMMRRRWPKGDSHVPGLIEGIVKTALVVFPKYGLTTPLVVAHAMAQFSHECGAGTEMEENLNYSAKRIAQVWPSRPEAIKYAHDPRGLANSVYGSRMGNQRGTDDGWNYRGRGFAQTTGKDEYARLGKKVGLDLIEHPEFLSDPGHALECGVGNFVLCGCLPFAERDNLNKVTKALNGGLIGLDGRRHWLAAWKRELL